jgi:hypothetical protein
VGNASSKRNTLAIARVLMLLEELVSINYHHHLGNLLVAELVSWREGSPALG